MSKNRTIIAKSYAWHQTEDIQRDEEDGTVSTTICYAVDSQNKTHEIQIADFCPHGYVEFLGLKKKSEIVELMTMIISHLSSGNGVKPVEWSYQKKLNLYQKKPMKVVKVSFRCESDLRRFSNTIVKFGVGYKNNKILEPESCIVHESSLETMSKLGNAIDIKMASWLSLDTTTTEMTNNLIRRLYESDKEDEVDELVKIHNGNKKVLLEKLSQLSRSVGQSDFFHTVSYGDLRNHNEELFVETNASFLSFDIECYASNHDSQIPTPTEPGNCVFMIGCVLGRIGKKETKKVLLSLFDPTRSSADEEKGIEIISFNEQKEGLTYFQNVLRNEKKLLLKFADLVNEYNPDCFIGYNILKFDWNYLIERAAILGISQKFIKMSRTPICSAEAIEKEWRSSAYGVQKFKYANVPGRLQLDVLLEIERNCKLPTYRLDAVAEKFLGEKKDDVTPKQMFMIYRLFYHLNGIVEKQRDPGSAKWNDENIPLPSIEEVHDFIERYMPTRSCKQQQIWNAKRKMLASSDISEIFEIVRGLFRIVGDYCIQDAVLSLRLTEKLKLWSTMEEMSNCVNVPMSYLHTRGQQIKVLSLLYRECNKRNILIPYQERDKEQPAFTGATVIDGLPGMYSMVASLDFSSLYPSIIIDNNFCHTTLLTEETVKDLPKDDYVEDTWDEHHGCGCEKDTELAKVKPEKVVCRTHRYFWKRMKYDREGNRIDEGLLPNILRGLLSARKNAKKAMERLKAEINMSTGGASVDDISDYKKKGYPIVPVGHFDEKTLTSKVVEANILDSRQLALKVTCNSVYGFTGIRKGAVAPLIQAAASVTRKGRKYLEFTIRSQERLYPWSNLVYGDTDSCMMRYNQKTPKENFEMAKDASRMITHFLKCHIQMIEKPDKQLLLVDGSSTTFSSVKLSDIRNIIDEKDRTDCYRYVYSYMNLDFEKMYGQYIFLTKKRYIATVINDEGKVIDDCSKGIVLVRRDNSLLTKQVYKAVLSKIKAFCSSEEIINTLYDEITKLFTMQMPAASFVVTKSIKEVISYAINIPDEDDPSKVKFLNRLLCSAEIIAEVSKVKKSDYASWYQKKKAESYYIDGLGAKRNSFAVNNILISRSEIQEAHDPHLFYKNPPAHVMLALRLSKLGIVIPTGTRMEYVILSKPGQTKDTLQGEKLEEYSIYCENKRYKNLKLDYCHYFEKQIAKPINELMRVVIGREPTAHFDVERYVDDCIEKVLDSKDIQCLFDCRLTNYTALAKFIYKEYGKYFGSDRAGVFTEKEINSMSEYDENYARNRENLILHRYMTDREIFLSALMIQNGEIVSTETYQEKFLALHGHKFISGIIIDRWDRYLLLSMIKLPTDSRWKTPFQKESDRRKLLEKEEIERQQELDVGMEPERKEFLRLNRKRVAQNRKIRRMDRKIEDVERIIADISQESAESLDREIENIERIISDIEQRDIRNNTRERDLSIMMYTERRKTIATFLGIHGQEWLLEKVYFLVPLAKKIVAAEIHKKRLAMFGKRPEALRNTNLTKERQGIGKRVAILDFSEEMDHKYGKIVATPFDEDNRRREEIKKKRKAGLPVPIFPKGETSKDSRYFTVVKESDGETVQVPRTGMGIVYMKDEDLIKGMILYREAHQKIIDEIRRMFRPRIHLNIIDLVERETSDRYREVISEFRWMMSRIKLNVVDDE